MLKAIAALIARLVRNTDAVASLGGDEFASLLAHCDEARALTVAE